MADAVRMYFDPLCPWAYQTSRWLRRLAELGEVVLDWGVFSLEIANKGTEESRAKGHARSERALRTVLVVRDAEGPDGVTRFAAALGARVHERGEAIDDPATVDAALDEAGLDRSLGAAAMAVDATWTRVVDEHTRLVERTRSFGVPTIVLDGGQGPAIFGPVLSNPPSDADAVPLWHHVSWLARYENFSELKRDRTIDPDLESFRAFRERQVSEGR